MIQNRSRREGYMIHGCFMDSEEKSYTLICDFCRKEISGFHDFYDAVNYKKYNGWKSIKVLNEWKDACPNCKGEIK